MTWTPLISEDRRVSAEALKNSISHDEMAVLCEKMPGFVGMPPEFKQDFIEAMWNGIYALQSPFKMEQMEKWLKHSNYRMAARYEVSQRIDALILSQKHLMRRCLGLLPGGFVLGYAVARLIPQVLAYIRGAP